MQAPGGGRRQQGDGVAAVAGVGPSQGAAHRRQPEQGHPAEGEQGADEARLRQELERHAVGVLHVEHRVVAVELVEPAEGAGAVAEDRLVRPRPDCLLPPVDPVARVRL